MFSEKGVGLFSVRIRGDEELIGFCGFVQLEGMEEMELSYGLTREVWGRGLATEASRVCLRFAFEEAGLERAIAGADASNGGSLRVIEKLGMRHVVRINPKVPAEPYQALYREAFFATSATFLILSGVKATASHRFCR